MKSTKTQLFYETSMLFLEINNQVSSEVYRKIDGELWLEVNPPSIFYDVQDAVGWVGIK